MAQDQLHQETLQAHMDALEKHRQLLSDLHLDNNEKLDQLNETFSEMAVTFEECLKLVGIP